MEPVGDMGAGIGVAVVREAFGVEGEALVEDALDVGQLVVGGESPHALICVPADLARAARGVLTELRLDVGDDAVLPGRRERGKNRPHRCRFFPRSDAVSPMSSIPGARLIG